MRTGEWVANTPAPGARKRSPRHGTALVGVVVALATMIVCFISVTVAATPGQWSRLGLQGGNVETLALDPLTPSTLYAGTWGAGVFKSTDTGINWQAMNNGLANPYINRLVVDPLTPTTLYAATDGGGVFKSTDGGATWQPVNGGLVNPSINALVVDPLTPSTLYAGTWGAGVFKSTDGGATWHAMNGGLTDWFVCALAVDPRTPTILYAATGGNYGIEWTGVFKSTDGGATWQGINGGVPRYWFVNVFAVDPRTPTTLYAGTTDGVFKSTDGGENWAVVGSFATTSLALDPLTPTTLYAGTWEAGVFKSTDAGASWYEMNSGLTSPYVYALALDPLTPTTLYAGTWGGGVFTRVQTAPPAATVLSPVGTVTTANPTYMWNAVSQDTWYGLWVNDSTGPGKIVQWYSATEAYCAGGTVCSVTPATSLAGGPGTWWVQTWNPGEYGPWSNGLDFTVSIGPPSAALLLFPAGSSTTVTPTYTWNAVSAAAWYCLWVNDSAGRGKIVQWYTAAQAHCATGTGTCSVTPSTTLASGAATWWVQTWNSAGYGPWSAGQPFTVGP